MKGDLVSEALDAVYRPPKGRLLVAFVEVIVAQIAIGGAMTEQRVEGDEDGVGHSENGTFVSSPRCQLVVLGGQVGAIGLGRGLCAASTRAERSQGLPRPVAPLLSVPALSLLPGHTWAQEDKCLAVGKEIISGPVSARISWAVRGPTPGMASATWMASSKGSIRSTTTSSIDSCAALYSATTGFEISPEELETATERAWNVGNASNVREGFDRKDDRLPPSWFQPLRDVEGREQKIRDYYGTKDLTPEDIEYLLDDYYDERGWTRETGIPSRKTLLELGLAGIARDLGLGDEHESSQI